MNLSSAGPGLAPAGPLTEARPRFLELLDSDAGRAWEEFHEFAWRLLRAFPPPSMRSLSAEEREDLIADVVFHCCEHDFRVLRRYRDMGVPFAAWLLRVAKHRALDQLRKKDRTAGPASDAGYFDDPDAHLSNRRLMDAVRKAFRSLSSKCRLLLAAYADGLKPREIAILLGVPEDNKKISDDLRYCRRNLEKLLEKDGFQNPFRSGGRS